MAKTLNSALSSIYDIIKSKTIGKVTIGNSGSGVKLVSCVLYCG